MKEPAHRRRALACDVARRFGLTEQQAGEVVAAVLLAVAREAVASARSLDRVDPDLGCGARVVAARLLWLVGAAAERAERRTAQRIAGARSRRRHTGNDPESR